MVNHFQNQWKKSSLNGRDLYNKGYYLAADEEFKKSFQIISYYIEEFFDHSAHFIQFLKMYNKSCYNLAYNYWKRDYLLNSESYFKMAIKKTNLFSKHLLKSEHKLIILQMSKNSLIHLNNFYTKTNQLHKLRTIESSMNYSLKDQFEDRLLDIKFVR